MYFGYECSNLILENDVCKGVSVSNGKVDMEIYAKAHRGRYRPPGCRLAGKALRGAQHRSRPRHCGYRCPCGGPQ